MISKLSCFKKQNEYLNSILQDRSLHQLPLHACEETGKQIEVPGEHEGNS